MKLAVLIPCYNEGLTIEKVVTDFKRELPDAYIYVYDNNSSDDTSALAKKAGAIVRKEPRQGKGFVVRQMFFDIDADYYIMVDGDDTYPAEAVHSLVQPLIDGEADMTIGDRLSNGTYAQENKRAFHGFGNDLVRNSINFLYNGHVNDVMTGYRGFNAAFVKSFPVMSNGFQIETEFTIHALDKRFKLVELPIDYRDRPEGSFSKLNTFSDGFKVLMTILRMVQESRPILFYGVLSLIFAVLGVGIGLPVIVEFAKTHFITKLPSAVLATGLIIIALLLLITGIILNAATKTDKKNYELNLYRVFSEINKNKKNN
ncbi:glycosyltransferase family 2 protein [Lacticaseibacillus hulanensis]|uniref:glycosyltransferase family 2 protein n=1 Tax=Lacticaseibacillus hulanensis TaxID=2493111 RepID=UPI000FD95753|nr:glycosyltransferase family 2 protein [Lacticaseibacillus hulanensis]